MNNIPFKLLIFSLFIISFTGVDAQQDTTGRKIPYSKDFTFADGIYMSFSSFKQNKPIAQSRIITDIARNDPEFYAKVLAGKYFFVLDNLGAARRINTSNAWGYVNNGEVYIYYNGIFNHISYMGSISHFLSKKKVYEDYYNSFYSDYTMYRRTPRRVTTETEEYILNMHTGEVHEYSIKSVSAALMRDPELYDEYQQLPRKKRDQLKFFYMRKYNKRNPFYIKPAKK